MAKTKTALNGALQSRDREEAGLATGCYASPWRGRTVLTFLAHLGGRPRVRFPCIIPSKIRIK